MSVYSNTFGDYKQDLAAIKNQREHSRKIGKEQRQGSIAGNMAKMKINYDSIQKET